MVKSINIILNWNMANWKGRKRRYIYGIVSNDGRVLRAVGYHLLEKSSMKQKIEKVKTYVPKVKKFLFEDVWLMDVTDCSFWRRLYVHFTRVGVTAVKSYTQDKCGLQASALTYITLVSLVPMIAIMFSFTKGLGMQRLLLDKIGMEKIHLEVANAEGENFEFRVLQPVKDEEGNIKSKPDGFAHLMPEPVQKAMVGILTYAEHTNFAALGLVGSLMLLVSVVTSIAKLEDCFNRIWGVTKPRSLLKKFSEYLIVLILAPLVFVLVTSMNTILMSSSVLGAFDKYAGAIAGAMVMLMRLGSCVLVLLMFAFFYMFMPHTKVKPLPAFMAGFVAGILWFGVQWAYIGLQVGLAKFNKIYGTFAVVPFFLAWLYANWSIILLGGELSYAIQNHRLFRIVKMPEMVPAGACMLLGQLVMYDCCKAFDNGENGWSPEKFGMKNAIPLHQLQYAVETLVRAKLLTPIVHDDPDSRFMPSRSSSLITFSMVEEAFRENHSVDAKVYFNLLPQHSREQFTKLYDAFSKGLEDMSFEKVEASGKAV